MSEEAAVVDQDLLAKWAEVKTVVEALELDVSKSAKGVKAAGVRARRGLRDLRGKVNVLIKASITADKADKATEQK